MKLTRATNYAVRALEHLARAESESDAKTDLRSLSRELEAPSAFLGKVLQSLAKAGLVSGSRGVHGGYRLAKRPRNIAVRDVVEATEGEVRLATCTAKTSKCGRSRSCAAGRFWLRLQNRINKALDSETLATLIAERSTRNRSG